MERVWGVLKRFSGLHQPVVLIIDYPEYPDPDPSIRKLIKIEESKSPYEVEPENLDLWEALRSLRKRRFPRADRFQYLIRDATSGCGGEFDLQNEAWVIEPERIKVATLFE
jgi:hypothetical protein